MMASTKTNTAKQEKIKQDEMTIKHEFLFLKILMFFISYTYKRVSYGPVTSLVTEFVTRLTRLVVVLGLVHHRHVITATHTRVCLHHTVALTLKTQV